METSPEIKALAAAMAKAQPKIKGAIKDSNNPFFKTKYADLASVWDACREALSDNGFSVIQGASAAGRTAKITTMLLHSSGEWVRDILEMTAVDEKPQSIGSAITYGRRYALAAIVGVCPEDDDGAAASGTVKQLSKAQENPGFSTGIPFSEHKAREAAKNSQRDLGTFSDYIVSTEKGKNGKRADGTPWQAYLIVTQDNGNVGTYSKEVYDLCTKAMNDGLKVQMETEPGKYGPTAKAAFIHEIPEKVEA